MSDKPFNPARRRFIALGAACACLPKWACAQSTAGYVCPPCGCAMDGRVFDAPGLCPACGMTLVPLAQAAPGETGRLQVPEDRTATGTRTIALEYLRLPATAANPGPPIVFLTGGPGGAAIPLARGAYAPLFSTLRQNADIILLDQRGAGRSSPIPPCPASGEPPLNDLTRAAMSEYYRREITRCFAWWRGQGIPIEAYNTRQSAADVDDLRKALGVPKVSLLAVSYGTHLAQAVLKYHGAGIDKVALAGLEGLDQTIKSPAALDSVIHRIATRLTAGPAARAAYPDLPAMMRRVHARLDETPAAFAGGRISGFAMQLTAGQFFRTTSGLANLPAFYRQLDEGDLSSLPLVYPQGPAVPAIRGMPEAMDLSSGASAARLAQIRTEAEFAILGDAMNFPIPHLAGAFPDLNLGDDFRAPFSTSVPALLIAGDLDGRTPLEEQRLTGRQFTNARWIEVENAAHDVLLGTPQIPARLAAFFRGEALAPLERLTNPALAFTLP